MNKRLNLALEKATQTKALVLRQGAINETARVFRELFPDERAVVIADKTTFAVAGKAVDAMLHQEGISVDAPVILDYPDMHAEWKYVELLDEVFSKTNAIPIAVGSGTINDLTTIVIIWLLLRLRPWTDMLLSGPLLRKMVARQPSRVLHPLPSLPTLILFQRLRPT